MVTIAGIGRMRDVGAEEGERYGCGGGCVIIQRPIIQESHELR